MRVAGQRCHHSGNKLLIDEFFESNLEGMSAKKAIEQIRNGFEEHQGEGVERRFRSKW